MTRAHVGGAVMHAERPLRVPVGPDAERWQTFPPDSRADRVRLSGPVPDALMEAGRAWPATSHPDQGEQLLAAHPEAAGRTLLVGDPCFDEPAASAVLRPAYRSALTECARPRLPVSRPT
ncbi:hypothetical protein [Streptomyces vietnamensis]|uniref:hypothetical protein n=1 Tax=Streptomyces vietnamensis TaxID=362257 RepID=UPI003F4D0A5E